MDGTHSQVTLQVDFVKLQYIWGSHSDLGVSRLVLVYLAQKTLHIWKSGKLYYNLYYSKAELVWFLFQIPAPGQKLWLGQCFQALSLGSFPWREAAFLKQNYLSTTDLEETWFLFCQE